MAARAVEDGDLRAARQRGGEQRDDGSGLAAAGLGEDERDGVVVHGVEGLQAFERAAGGGEAERQAVG